MKLYKDHGTNPVSGCLPLLLQIPVFIALFRVMNEFKPKNGEFVERHFGLSHTLIEQGAKAKVFGAPISASFMSSNNLLHQLGGTKLTVQIVTVVMIVVMGASQFWTQRQLMARAGAPADAQQAQIQKTMLYVLPLFFAVAGVNFPIGVLLYWLTTNIWSMGQQHYVIKRMPPLAAGGAPGKGGGSGKPAPVDKGPTGGGPATTASVPEQVTEESASASASPAVLTANAPGTRRAAGSRKNKKKGRR
jgi:YidC/Oxa1 family membrane protein insertase